MPELFEFPPTRSNRAKWALEELGEQYTSRVVDFTAGAQQSSDYKAINPLGHVPSYRTADYTMYESVAIVMQLLDCHPEAGLAPALGTAARAAYYQWCVFAASELDPVLFDIMKHTMHLPEEKRIPEIAERALSGFASRAAVLSAALGDQEFLLGSDFSGADIAIGYDCNWAEYTGLIGDYPVLVEYYNRLSHRPAFQTVFANQRVSQELSLENTPRRKLNPEFRE